MTPFPKGKGRIQQIYIPQSRGLAVQRSTGTTDHALAKRMERAIQVLADKKRWVFLRAIKNNRLSVEVVYEAVVSKTLKALAAELKAVTWDGEYFESWLAHQKTVAPKSWPDQERQVRRMLEDVTYAHEVTPGVVRDKLATLGVSDGTKRHYLYSLSSYCNHLIAHNVVKHNPCGSKVHVPRPKKARKRTVWRTADVDQAIINRLSGDVRIAAVICAASGADRSTPLLMKVRDIKLLPVGEQPDNDRGREHRVDLPGTKTEQRMAKGIRLEPWAAPILREWIKGKHPDTPLITYAQPDTISENWTRAAKEERQEGYMLRDTRHSYGCRAFLAGYSLWEVSKWLRHKNPYITADVYLAMDYEVAQAVRGQMEKLGFERSDTTASDTRHNALTLGAGQAHPESVTTAATTPIKTRRSKYQLRKEA